MTLFFINIAVKNIRLEKKILDVYTDVMRGQILSLVIYKSIQAVAVMRVH